MAKKSKTKRRRTARRPKAAFAVIQATLRNNQKRTFFADEQLAILEARGILTGECDYGYQPPDRMLVVRVVRAVDAKRVTRVAESVDAAKIAAELDVETEHHDGD